MSDRPAIETDNDPEAFLDAWGEQMIYTPAVGDARTITAIVDRNVRTRTVVGTSAPQCEVMVANRATSITDDGYGGISSAALDRGGDKLTFAPVIGGADRDWTINKIIAQDGGMLTLEVR
jgi:hypothetical protein